jgi:hypothetical protein
MGVEYMGDIVVEWFSYKVILRERETVAVFFSRLLDHFRSKDRKRFFFFFCCLDDDVVAAR